jgi:hypothetical protein
MGLSENEAAPVQNRRTGQKKGSIGSWGVRVCKCVAKHLGRYDILPFVKVNPRSYGATRTAYGAVSDIGHL